MMPFFVLREENRGRVSSLSCPAAGRGGGVQGGQSPFIPTLDAAGSVCSPVAPGHNKAFCEKRVAAHGMCVQGGLGALPSTSRKAAVSRKGNPPLLPVCINTGIACR